MAEHKDNAALIARILQGARWATLLRLSAQLISWASTLVVLRFVSSADYGLNAMLEAPLELLFLVSTLGLDLALVRSRRLEPDSIRSVFGWLLLVNAGLFCAYFFGGRLIAAYFNEPRLEALARAVAFLFLLVPFRVIPNAILDRELKFKLRAVVELIGTVIAALATLALAIRGHGVWALVIGLLVGRSLSAILLMVIQPWIAVPAFNLKIIRGMLALGGTLTLASALALTAGMLPVVIGGRALGPALLGLYTVALQFAMLPLSKVMPIVNSIAFPAFSKFEGQPAAVGGYIATSLGTGALLLLPVMWGLASASGAFSQAVLGAAWADAALPLAALSLVMPLRGIGLFLRQVVAGIGRADINLKAAITMWVAGLPAVLAGVGFGIGGLVAAFALTEIVTFVVTYRLARQAIVLPGAKLWGALRAAVTATLAMSAAMLWCGLLMEGRPPLAILLAQVGAGGVTYASVVRAFFWPQARQFFALVRR